MTKPSHATVLEHLSDRPKPLSGPQGAPQAADLLGRAMRAAGVSQRRLARSQGVSASLVGMWCQLTRPESPSLRRLVLAAKRHPSLVREVARALLELVDGNGAPLDQRAHALLLAKECGDVAAAVAEALADGQLTEDERRRIDAELADVAERVAQARRDLTS